MQLVVHLFYLDEIIAAKYRTLTQEGRQRMKKYALIMIMLTALAWLAGEVTYSDSLLKAAKSGNPQAQNQLGICYSKGLGIKYNKSKAISYFRLAAEQGLADAQYHLGGYYYHNKKEMLKWYNRAAEQNHPGALVALGNAYSEGNGVSKDLKIAAGYYRRAAESGDPSGQFWYGYANYWGQGVLKNYAEAARYFRLAAEQKHSNAMFLLGICYFNGNGVEKNLETAYYWYLLANATGSINVQSSISEVEKLLTTEQKNNAQNQAQTWLTEHNMQ